MGAGKGKMLDVRDRTGWRGGSDPYTSDSWDSVLFPLSPPHCGKGLCVRTQASCWYRIALPFRIVALAPADPFQPLSKPGV